MNLIRAKILRGAAGYKNQSKTPGKMQFPGVARFYKHISYLKQQVVETQYVPARNVETWEIFWFKLHTVKQTLVRDRYGRPIPIMQEESEFINIETGKRTPQIEPAYDLVPVTKPARLDPQCAKGVYRALKRMARKGLLEGAYEAAREFTAAQAVQTKAV